MVELNVSDLLRALQILERNVSVTLMYSGLRIPQYRLLSLLQEHGQLTVTDVSKQLNITRATASVQTNELINSGIIAVVESEMQKYLRPETLFGNKFESYLQEAVVKNKVDEEYNSFFKPDIDISIEEFARGAM